VLKPLVLLDLRGALLGAQPFLWIPAEQSVEQIPDGIGELGRHGELRGNDALVHDGFVRVVERRQTGEQLLQEGPQVVLVE
jgi:hypothetical protein